MQQRLVDLREEPPQRLQIGVVGAPDEKQVMLPFVGQLHAWSGDKRHAPRNLAGPAVHRKHFCLALADADDVICFADQTHFKRQLPLIDRAILLNRILQRLDIMRFDDDWRAFRDQPTDNRIMMGIVHDHEVRL